MNTEARIAELERQLAAMRPETADERIAREEREYQAQRVRSALVAKVHGCTERLADFTARLVDPERFHDVLVETLKEATAELDGIRAGLVEVGRTGDVHRRRGLEGELGTIEQVIDAITSGSWGESGNLEERLFARGLRPQPGKQTIFQGRFSLKRTQNLLTALREERARIEAELNAAKAELEGLTT